MIEMIDVHSHILPGIDDGSKDLDMTIDMITNAVDDGTTGIVATPHYCFDYGSTIYKDVIEYVEKLNQLIKKKGIDLKVYCGQEVYIYEETIKDLENGVIGTINNSRYMLIEWGLHELPDDLFDIIYELQIRNIVPVIAHIERYRFIIEDNTLIDKFIDEGCLFQLNTGSITGIFGSSVKKTAKILIEKGIYSFIGSDAHSCGRRCTGINTAINMCEKIKPGYRCELLNNAVKLINDEEILFNGEKINIKKKKSLFSFFRNK